MVNSDPDNALYRSKLLLSLRTLAEVYREQENSTAELQVLLEAQQQQQQLDGATDESLEIQIEACRERIANNQRES